LSGCAKQTNIDRYLYIGPVHTFHALADLRQLSVIQQSECKRFLEGQFTIIAPRTNKRSSERLETPGGMTARLIRQGLVLA